LPAVGAWPVMAGQVLAGPAEVAPQGFARQAEQAAILAAALAGIELGAWDWRVVGWRAGLDASTVLTIASWIVRARAAGLAR